MQEVSLDGREKIIECVRRWGGSSSDAVLDKHCCIYSPANIDGLVGYRLEKGCAVVYGDPVCSKEDVQALTKCFHSYCAEKGHKIVYVAATHDFLSRATKEVNFSFIEFGEELSLNPQNNPAEGSKGSLLRRKVRHARHENVVVEEYKGQDEELEEALENVGVNWLKSRKGPQVYTSNVRLFDDRQGKRWFYAKKGDLVVGVVVLNLLKNRGGWHLNHLMYTQEASGGTSEILVMTAIEALRDEGCNLLTFGTVPLSKLGDIEGLKPWAILTARGIYNVARKLFNLDGKKMFWGKFQPNSQQSYLVFCKSQIGIREVVAILKALNLSY